MDKDAKKLRDEAKAERRQAREVVEIEVTDVKTGTTSKSKVDEVILEPLRGLKSKSAPKKKVDAKTEVKSTELSRIENGEKVTFKDKH